MAADGEARFWFGSIGDAYNWTINRADTEVKGVWRSWAKRRLESELSDIVRVASGHKKDKVAIGDSRYQELWRIADEKVTTFCNQHNVPRSSIEAQVPALTELKALAQVPVVVPHQTAKRIGAGAVGGSMLIIVLGIMCGFVHSLFLFGMSVSEGIGHGLHWLIHLL